jgi:hypothetical protein
MFASSAAVNGVAVKADFGVADASATVEAVFPGVVVTGVETVGVVTAGVTVAGVVVAAVAAGELPPVFVSVTTN